MITYGLYYNSLPRIVCHCKIEKIIEEIKHVNRCFEMTPVRIELEHLAFFSLKNDITTLQT